MYLRSRPYFQSWRIQRYTYHLQTHAVRRLNYITVSSAFGSHACTLPQAVSKLSLFFLHNGWLEAIDFFYSSYRYRWRECLGRCISTQFPCPTPAAVFCHLQQNIEAHLHDQQFSQGVIKDYIHDIFGYNDPDENIYHEGLVDCSDTESFDELLASMETTWNKREEAAFSDCKSHRVQFFSWFMKYKAHEFREYTLCFLREEAGLGSPLKAFYTNDSESINAVLKERVDYKKQQWAVSTRNEKNS